MDETSMGRSASLPALIASRAIIPGAFSEKSDAERAAEEEQRTQSMMYAARMKYLQDEDQVKPDTLFMTRKQAQKHAHQDGIKMSLRKIDVSAGHHHGARKPNAAEAKIAAFSPPGRRRSRLMLDDRQQTWIPVTQAGCHFWQSQETGECRSAAPSGYDDRVHPGLAARFAEEKENDAKQDDPPFPDSFAFLNDGHNAS